MLEALARHIQYEVAVGLNGRVWVNADSPTIIILVANAISNSEFLTPAQTETLVAKLVEVIVTGLPWGIKPACSSSLAQMTALVAVRSLSKLAVSAAVQCARQIDACLPLMLEVLQSLQIGRQ